MNVHCFGDVWNSSLRRPHIMFAGRQNLMSHWGARETPGVTVGSLRSDPSVFTLWAGHLTCGGLSVPLDTVRGRGQVSIRILKQALGKHPSKDALEPPGYALPRRSRKSVYALSEHRRALLRARRPARHPSASWRLRLFVGD